MATHEKTIQELRLEIQELRQAVIFLLSPFNNGGIAINDKSAEQHYEKLGSYPKVEVKENLMDCCSGGPQWGHSYMCPSLPGQEIKMNNDEYYYSKYEEEFTNKLANEWEENENSN